MFRRAHFIVPGGCVRFKQFLFCIFAVVCRFCMFQLPSIDLLKTKRRQLYLKIQSVPRCKHFTSRLQKPNSLCCKWHKPLYVLW